MREDRGLYIRLYVSAFIPAVLALLIYLPALGYGFVNWDDWAFVGEPNIREINGAFFKWAFTSVVGAHWCPLTITSFAIDHALWGESSAGYHLTNMILHALNTFLCALLTVKLSSVARGRVSPNNADLFAGLVTGLFFGLHPLRVESVVWVTERKDVLSVFFYLLSVFFYVRYAADKGRKNYVAALASFILSLMSKPMAVSLPFVLLIIDFYPFKRLLASRRVLLEKAPFFVLLPFSMALTVWSQKQAIVNVVSLSLPLRLATAVKGAAFYIYKTILPINLAPYYPLFPDTPVFTFDSIAAALLLIAITVFCLISLKWTRFYAALWAFYLITVLPVIGIVQVGGQSAADRFTYLPGTVFFMLAASALSYTFRNRNKLVAPAVALVLILSSAMAYRTLDQMAVWKDSISLWTHQIRLYPIVLAYENRAKAYMSAGRYEEAAKDLTIVMESGDSSGGVFVRRGAALQKAGYLDAAVRDFSSAIEKTGDKNIYRLRAAAYEEMGEREKAAEDLRKAE